MTGSGYANVSTYAANFQYRASGAAKHVDYGNTKTLDVNYNARLQATSFNIPGVISKTYDYQADGRLRFSGDQLDHRFDRSYSYDQANRISEALSGAEARGEPSTSNRPYNQAYQYDAFDHLTNRGANSLWPPFGDTSGRLWSGPGSSFTPNPQAYVNDRNTLWQYDAAGNLADSGSPAVNGVHYTYDAMGAVTHSVSNSVDLNQSFDGEGQSAKKVESDTIIDDGGTPITTTSTTFFIRSSLSGNVIAEIDQSGQKRRGFVYAGQSVLAWQQQLGATQSVEWEHRDPSDASFRMTDGAGTVDSAHAAELDPLGNDAGLTNPYAPPHQPGKLWFGGSYPGFGDRSGDGAKQCIVDFLERPCDEAAYQVQSRMAARCPNNNCGPRWNGTEWEFLRFTDDGLSFGGLNSRPAGPPKLKPISDPERARRKQIKEQGGWNPFGVGSEADFDEFLFGPQNTAANHESGHTGPKEACDLKLAALFGGQGAVADTGLTPWTLLHSSAGIKRFPDHSAEGGVMHLYTNAQGTGQPGTVGLYVPDGFTAVLGGRGTQYYPNKPGQVNAGQVNYNYAQYRNSASITISFVHIGSPVGPPINALGSTLVGSIAGPGGDGPGYNHTHINFYSNFAKGTRVDPRKLFCKEFGF